MRLLLPGIALALFSVTCTAQENTVMIKTLFPHPQDLVQGIPADFPRFYFAGQDERAQLLSRYLWHHFSTRLGNGRTLFNKEYLTCADFWLGGAVDAKRGKPIQQVHREDILGMQLDPDGYVHTHQHHSQAHETGWPFPMWTQAGRNGGTAGWHFDKDASGWAMDALRSWKDPRWLGETAADGWVLENAESRGIVDKRWLLESTGNSPSIVSPRGVKIEAFQAPFLQIRWLRDPEPSGATRPYVEWQREGDRDFSPDRRVYFDYSHADPSAPLSGITGTKHTMITMHTHPKWNGTIKRLRFCLAPGESNVTFRIESIFTCYDTRHTINNPIFVFACWNCFRWTGDISFLIANIDRMRRATRYQMTEMGGLEFNRIRNRWIGHDGRPGWTRTPDGRKEIHGGRGIGSNYWDLLPFGWDDMYATSQYYASLLVMADVEQAILDNPGWNVPRGAYALDPAELRRHAAAVKAEANRRFWDARKGRFIACIDSEGARHDYGFTFLNLDAIWYGIASDVHARAILDWLSGKRIVDGDTSTGTDIYHWRFGPRATTLRNVEWYTFPWTNPESIPWGGQVQDGGAVLGFTFYDLMARLKYVGPDDAWKRLGEILSWEKDVWAEGGYREYYKDGKRGTTLQGGGTAGGLGIDFEFFESSLLPGIVVYGFLGLDPDAVSLGINPRLPKDCPEMGVSNVLYRGCRLDIKAANGRITVLLKDKPLDPIQLRLNGKWEMGGLVSPTHAFARPGVYELVHAEG